MKREKNRFLTFIFSLMPGAGHMYLGFMKIGLSIMSLFFAIIAFSIFLNAEAIGLVLPIIWFYSFFDILNKRYTTDEEFQKLEDKYLFFDELMGIATMSEERKFRLSKWKKVVGIVLLILGVNLIWEAAISKLILLCMPYYMYSNIEGIFRNMPKIIIAIVIIYISIKLIQEKKLYASN